MLVVRRIDRIFDANSLNRHAVARSQVSLIWWFVPV